MLHKLGYQVDVANNGFEALSAVASAHYDLILMDCVMPEMDGFEATRRLRSGGGDGAASSHHRHDRQCLRRRSQSLPRRRHERLSLETRSPGGTREPSSGLATIGGVSAHALKQLIREVPDFPKPGINFYDITTLLKDKQGFRETVDALARALLKVPPVDIVVGIEARGYFFAPAMAHALGAGFVPVRKPKKLPYTVRSVEYALEYGTDQLEMHADAIEPGQNVLIIDDVLATGGTASAVARLVELLGGKVAGLGFVIELAFLKGREKLQGYDVFSLLQY